MGSRAASLLLTSIYGAQTQQESATGMALKRVGWNEK